jgi:hypothetical protein
MTFSQMRSVCLAHPAFEGAQPWLSPLLSSAEDWPSLGDFNSSAKKMAPKFPWEFVVQEKVSRRAKTRGLGSLSTYLDLVISQGKIPVRERNMHDLLNALSFMMFPQAKAALNRRHYKESPNGLIPGQNRTRTQDHLTIFDEGGVLRLKTLVPNSAQGWSEKDFIFGHAIYEHIINGKVLRAARLDLHFDSDLNFGPTRENLKLGVEGLDGRELVLGQQLSRASIEQVTAMADKTLADCLQNEQNFVSATEFSHLWINL